MSTTRSPYPTYYEYVQEHFFGRDDIHGDLAAEMRHDPAFPRGERRREPLRVYLEEICKADREYMISFNHTYVHFWCKCKHIQRAIMQHRRKNALQAARKRATGYNSTP